MRDLSICTVTICTLIVATTANAQLAPAPRLTLSQESWDFGKVWHPDPVYLDLGLRNDGAADLHISKVSTTCGCTVAQPERKVIPPGEKTSVRVQFITTGKQNEVHSKVIIESDDPANPKVEFPVKGFVRRAVTREPLGGLVIRTLDTRPGQTDRVRLAAQVDEPMRLRLLESTLEAADFRIEEVEPWRVYDIVGKTNREILPGTLTGKLKLSTALEREPVLEVPVRIQVIPETAPSPPALRVHEQPKRRIVNIRYYGTRDDFRVTAVKPSSDKVQVTLNPPRPAAGYELRLDPRPRTIVTAYVDMPAEKDLPPGGATIVFETTDPKNPEFDVLLSDDGEAVRAKFHAPPANFADKD